ncbi:hypothetical protein Tco_1314801 [Tanacetum coccineum]
MGRDIIQLEGCASFSNHLRRGGVICSVFTFEYGSISRGAENLHPEMPGLSGNQSWEFSRGQQRKKLYNPLVYFAEMRFAKLFVTPTHSRMDWSNLRGYSPDPLLDTLPMSLIITSVLLDFDIKLAPSVAKIPGEGKSLAAMGLDAGSTFSPPAAQNTPNALPPAHNGNFERLQHENWHGQVAMGSQLWPQRLSRRSECQFVEEAYSQDSQT